MRHLICCLVDGLDDQSLNKQFLSSYIERLNAEERELRNLISRVPGWVQPFEQTSKFRLMSVGCQV